MVSSTLALLFFFFLPIVSEAATPEVRYPVEYRGYFFHLSIRPSFVQGPAFKMLARGPWPGAPGLGALAWGHWPGGLGLGALVWGPWSGGLGLGTLAWGPWPGDRLGVRLDHPIHPTTPSTQPPPKTNLAILVQFG